MNEIEHLRRSPPPLRGLKYYLACRYYKRPLLVNLEVTKRCNARCDFCACWRTAQPEELSDYIPVIKRFRPVVVSISGGEPLVRRDLIDIMKRIRPYCHYLVMITNGALLTPEVADRMYSAGLNQLAVSLDYMDERHDEIRRIPGLFGKIADVVPKLTSKGYKLTLNTVIMEANLDHIIPLTHKARSWGAGISFSTYCSLKRNDDALMIKEDKLERLRRLVLDLKRLKKELKNVRNSDYYLDGITEYFETGGIRECKAGKSWVQVTPDGFIQPCSELPRMCRYDEYDRKRVPRISCTQCWYTCRGEAEASHLAPARLLELIRS